MGSALLALAIMILLIVLKVPIGVSLGLAGFLGLWWAGGLGVALGQIASLPYGITASYPLAVLPMFIFMGHVAGEAGFTGQLYGAALKWLGHVRGGLAMATTAGAAVFAACTGSTAASAATFTRLSLPEMMRYGYDKGFAAGSIAAAGTLAAMIPPSITMVIYGIVTETSIGKILVAGFIPGILTALIFCVGIYALARANPALAPSADIRATWRERFAAIKGVWGVALLFLLVMGGIYQGVFTPSAAGAVGAFGALALAIASRGLTVSRFRGALLESCMITSSIFVIIVGGMLFSRFLALTGAVATFAEFISGLPVPGVVIMLAIMLMYLFLGCLIDPISMMILTLPVVFPVVISLGYDPIWFGIFVVVMVEIATLTPPVGINCFVVSAASNGAVTTGQVFRGVTPYLVMEVPVIALLFAFPQIALWLPSRMIG